MILENGGERGETAKQPVARLLWLLELRIQVETWNDQWNMVLRVMVLRVFQLRAGELTYTQTPAGFLWESAGIKNLVSPLHVWPALSIGSEFLDKEMQVETREVVQSIADFSCTYEYPSSVPRICLKDFLGVGVSCLWGHRERQTSDILWPDNLFYLVSSKSRENLSQNGKVHSARRGMTLWGGCPLASTWVANTCTCMYTHTQWGADKSGQQALPKKE